ncbi:MAG: phosphoenolpyruvate carboxykinase (ATP) [Gammaproteobacteria bacterium]|nr:phosphoenolpyruvate carboxykinase (ATP) [Gammaproteobacteria bacterium]
MSVDLSYLGLVPDGVYFRWPTPKLVEAAVKNNEGHLLHNLAFAVRTGHTGRSPKDRFVVDDANTHDTVKWNAINQPIAEANFDAIFERIQQYVRAYSVWVQDVYAGADERYQVPVRFIGSAAWQALFVRNMFIVPEDDEYGDFKPEWNVIGVPGMSLDESLALQLGLHSSDFILVNFTRKLVLVGGTGYAGEIKKSMFTVLNYLLPEQGVLPMHASVNVGHDDVVTVFFGLSGTGKTTLSMDPERLFLGDDEHGWSDDGVFNFEGGCYAKTIRLSAENEPLIYAATERHGTTVENVAWDPLDRYIDYDDGDYTENGRASFAIDAIPGAILSGKAGHPACIIFLTADAFGVLPPVARLSPEQAAYHFSLGYTAKVAGTERGVKEPEPVFSALYGEPFFPRSHATYIKLFMEKLRKHNLPVWLVNTGWTGGKYGVGKRIDIPVTRAIIRAIQEGELGDVEFTTNPVFGFDVPLSCPDVPSGILDPASTWADKAAYKQEQQALAQRFIDRAATLELPAEVLAQNPRI